jgi:hypothetical protein
MARQSRPFARRLARLLGCSALVSLLPFCVPALAQEWEPPPLPRTNLGTVGLIEMPSARMAADGELSAGASYFKANQHYNLGFQILPWLEGSFRYSGIQHFDPTYSVYWDRSFGMKLRLWNESRYLPTLAVGINDIVGTGLYSGEYIVASKQFGPFDATVGMGWGRLGTANTIRNPLAQLSRSFEFRPSLTTPGGTNFDVYLHGPTTGLFGGLTWRTPIPGLTAIVETSSDSYLFERIADSFAGPGGFYPRTQMNYGLSYQASEGLTLGLNWLYGRAIGGSLSLQFNPSKPQYAGTLSDPPLAPAIRPREAQQAALRNMLGQRDPAQAAQRVRLTARAASRNAFVDTLLDQGNVTDVRVNGTSLTVSLARGATAQTCPAIIRIVQESGTGIREILVRQGGGLPPLRCPVPRGVAAPMLQNASLSGINLVALQAPLTIDATETAATVDPRTALRKFRAAAKKQQIHIEAVSFGESVATVYYANTRYFHEDDAIERLTRVLMAEAPPTIEKFRLIAMGSGLPQQEYTVLRAPAERALSDNRDDVSVFDSGVLIDAPPLYNPVLAQERRGTYPSFDWSVFPQFRQQFFDPNNPFGVQVLGAAWASLELAPGLSLWGQGELSVFDTFETGRLNDSVLPHVRTDFVKYFTQGKNGIGALELDYRFRLTPEVFAIARAGYLESMFAGAGGEILYRPQGQRWAIGADLYGVWQRDFDRLFGLQRYRQVTGHVTLYYASPWYDLDFQLRAGQYLAGDRGATLQVTRRFSTGIEIGAFVTKTNVSAADFGEGSFDKGIVIRIPINWVAPIDTQSQVAMDLRPVQRDGGQVLAGDATLYLETRRTSESEIVRNDRHFANQ